VIDIDKEKGMEPKKIIVETKNGPAPKGQYSQVVIGGPFVFISGQLPFTPEGKLAEGEIVPQTKQIFDNIAAMLGEAGSSLEKVVKVGIYMTDMDDFPMMNQTYSTYFPKDPPARTTVIVKRFPPGVRIEVDVVALA
jgi:2-iminobutanoate/2-iminopropanoate deaminase